MIDAVGRDGGDVLVGASGARCAKVELKLVVVLHRGGVGIRGTCTSWEVSAVRVKEGH